MKLSKRQLRRIIRKTIVEAWDPFAVTELKADPSVYSTGDQPITKDGKPMEEVVRGMVSWCQGGGDISPKERADWVYSKVNEDCNRSRCREHSREIASHVLEELGLSEFKRTPTPMPHHGWHMSDR